MIGVGVIDVTELTDEELESVFLDFIGQVHGAERKAIQTLIYSLQSSPEELPQRPPSAVS